MRLLTCTVENFGSYKHLEIDFSNVGLGLIYGRTGSGKSTIPDIAAWTLFGVTAKEGAVDEVRSWLSGGECTTGTLSVELPNGKITVCRTRGKASQNDLFWIEESTPDKQERGKDINDTQRKLNQRLGVDADLYLSGAYFHEFSPSGSFFTAKAKERRDLFEKIANLVLPTSLAEKSAEHRKAAKADLDKKQSQLDRLSGRLEQLERTLVSRAEEAERWDVRNALKLQEIEAKAKTFESDKKAKISALQAKHHEYNAKKDKEFQALGEQIQTLSNAVLHPETFDSAIKDLEKEITKAKNQICGECGGPKCGPEYDKLKEQLFSLKQEKTANFNSNVTLDRLREQHWKMSEDMGPYQAQIEQVRSQRNVYLEQLEQLKEETNPYLGEDDKLNAEMDGVISDMESMSANIESLECRVSALTQLYDLSFDLRGELLKKSVREIEASTNNILDRHFDAELRVAFTLDADELEVSIKKSGYDCVYRQLSKGQRQLLKLAFVVSIMKASSNRAGVHFANLFFDEALDGLDADLKVKAFSLFSELETNHESILLIDHAPEFQNLFSKRYHVTMSEDISDVSLEES